MRPSISSLAGHVFGFAHSQFTIRAMVKTYVSETGVTNEGGFLPWLLRPVTRTLTQEHQEAQRQSPDIATANLLMGLTTTDRPAAHCRQSGLDAEPLIGRASARSDGTYETLSFRCVPQ
jgi:hypothetical protein